MTLINLFSKLKTGRGRGNWDHKGIPGHRGGSAPSGQAMTENEVASLWEWSGDNYLEVSLQDNKGHASPSLKSAIEKLPDYQGYLQRFDHRETNYKKGEVIELPALTSFAQKGSSLESTRGWYEKTKYIIKNAKGKKLTFSHRPNELEVILNKGVKLKVVDIKEVELPPGGTNKVGVTQKVIELQQL